MKIKLKHQKSCRIKHNILIFKISGPFKHDKNSLWNEKSKNWKGTKFRNDLVDNYFIFKSIKQRNYSVFFSNIQGVHQDNLYVSKDSILLVNLNNIIQHYIESKCVHKNVRSFDCRETSVNWKHSACSQ